MHWTNTLIAGWLSMALWYVPEPDYMGIWFERSMRSNVLPHIPGI